VFRRIAVWLWAVVAVASIADGQQAVSSINQARLFTTPSASAVAPVEPTGNAGEDSARTEDDSFGTQIVLKNQQRVPLLTVYTNTSAFYTTNVDLAPDHTRGDAFLIADAGVAWRRAISATLLADAILGGSVFRYDRASELDFERLAAGTGLTWAIPGGGGAVAFGRYDFTELLDTEGGELLRDHAFTAGAQKVFSFSRPHSLSVGVFGVGGISIPNSQEREQAGAFGGYHLQFSRSVGADLLYRYAAQFYTENGRIDHNQTLALAVSWTITAWLRLDALVSAARNDSNRAAFEYDAFNSGGAARLSARF
jgi:hypothetical protein